MSDFQNYPKWKYHAVEEATIVKSAEEDQALGPEWVESPAETQKIVEVKAVDALKTGAAPAAKKSKKNSVIVGGKA